MVRVAVNIFSEKIHTLVFCVSIRVFAHRWRRRGRVGDSEEIFVRRSTSSF